MGGCMILILLPFLVGVGFAMVVVPIALWVYIVWAAIMLAIVAGIYIVLARRGVFKRYAEGEGWKRYTAQGAKWVLIIAMVYLVLTGGVAVAFQCLGMKTFTQATYSQSEGGSANGPSESASA